MSQDRPGQREIVPGYPVCSRDHGPENMRIIALSRGINAAQREVWRCSACRAEFRCQLEVGRDVPEVLRP